MLRCTGLAGEVLRSCALGLLGGTRPAPSHQQSGMERARVLRRPTCAAHVPLQGLAALV